jgi:hypothetical protein
VDRGAGNRGESGMVRSDFWAKVWGVKAAEKKMKAKKMKVEVKNVSQR